MATKKNDKVRILISCLVEGMRYQPNDIVNMPVKIAKDLVDRNKADTSGAAVKYCLSIGKELMDHAPVRAELSNEDNAIAQALINDDKAKATADAEAKATADAEAKATADAEVKSKAE